MPRRVIKQTNRIALRVQADDKAVIMRAVSVAQTDMNEPILHDPRFRSWHNKIGRKGD